jgi:hypothetical protein
MQRRRDDLHLAVREPGGHALQQVDEALRAGIDDAREARLFEHALGVGERAPHRFDHGAEQRAEIRRLGLADDAFQFGREIRQHRQQRSLARLRQCVARIGGADPHGGRETGGIEALEMPDAVTDAEQELREDRAGVAARAVERGIRDLRQQLAGVPRRFALERGQHGRERHRHVGAGVAVGHREHVDLVDVVRACEQPVDAGAQRVGELRTIELFERCGAHWIGTRKRLPFQDSTAPSGTICSMRRPLGRVLPSLPRWPLTNTKRFAGSGS